MHIVRCIDGDFTKAKSEVVKNIFTVGDDDLLPKAGKEYEVIGYHIIGDKREAYLLAGLDTTAYGAQLTFPVERFETVKQEYIPNAVLPDDVFGGGLCMQYKVIMEMDFSLPKEKE